MGQETLMGVFNSAKSIKNLISMAFRKTYTISTLRIAVRQSWAKSSIISDSTDLEAGLPVPKFKFRREQDLGVSLTGQEMPRVKKLVASDLAQLPSVKSGVSPRISLSLALERASVPNLPNRLTDHKRLPDSVGAAPQRASLYDVLLISRALSSEPSKYWTLTFTGENK
ncbi:hypothetical protein BDR06DRAFT_966767 [Suillus hirtellus]|nr:hypothetical protein BDR06DRAFT_966767 [Suillus hirtellus]